MSVYPVVNDLISGNVAQIRDLGRSEDELPPLVNSISPDFRSEFHTAGRIGLIPQAHNRIERNTSSPQRGVQERPMESEGMLKVATECAPLPCRVCRCTCATQRPSHLGLGLESRQRLNDRLTRLEAKPEDEQDSCRNAFSALETSMPQKSLRPFPN